MARYRIETSHGWAITVAVLCLTGVLGCSLSKVLVEPLVEAAVNSRQEAPVDPALATRTPCPTFTPAGGPVVLAPTPGLEATPTLLPVGDVAPPVALLPGGIDAPEPAPDMQLPPGTEAGASELDSAETDMSELDMAEFDLTEPDMSELALDEADAAASELVPCEIETPEVAPSDTATPRPKPKPAPGAQPTATRRPVARAAAVPPTQTPMPTITPTPKFAYNVVEVYSASTTNAFLIGYIMIVNADDIPIGGVKAVGNFDPGGAHHESPLSKWFFEGYSAPGPVLKTSSVKFEPPGSIQQGTWFIHLESEQGARLSEDVPFMTDPAKPEWFFIEFKQPGLRSTPAPTPKPSTPTVTPKPVTPTATATDSST